MPDNDDLSALGAVEAEEPSRKVDDLSAFAAPAEAPPTVTQPTFAQKYIQSPLKTLTAPARAEEHLLNKYLVAPALGALQAGAQAGHGLSQLLVGATNAALRTHLQSPEPDVFVGPARQLKGTIPAKVGEALGIIGAIGVPGAAVSRIAEAAPLLGRAAPLLGRALGYGATMAAETPGDPTERGLAGVAGMLGGTGEYMLTKGLPYLSDKALANLITKSAETQKNIGELFYKAAFHGTENIKPEISSATQSAINDLVKIRPGKNVITKAITRYNENKTPETLHGLKSDFGKIISKLNDKAAKSGLSSTEGDEKMFLEHATDNIGKDLEETMRGISPDKYDHYQIAQQHWKNNVVPFRQYTAIRKVLGPEKEISTGIRKQLITKAESAERLRNILQLRRAGLRIGGVAPSIVRRIGAYGLPTAAGYEVIRRLLGE